MAAVPVALSYGNSPCFEEITITHALIKFKNVKVGLTIKMHSINK